MRIIKSINTIIKKDWKNRTIYQILDDFKKNDEIREYEFPLTKKILSDLLLNGKIEMNYIFGNNTYVND